MYRAIAKNKRNTVFIIILFLVILGALGVVAALFLSPDPSRPDWSIPIITIVIAGAYAAFQYYLGTREDRLEGGLHVVLRSGCLGRRTSGV